MDVETAEGQPPSLSFVDENSPLLINENPEDDDVLLGDIPPWTLIEIAVTAVATLTVGSAIGVLLISSNPLVIATGVLGLLIPPYSAFQEQKKTDCIAMEQTSETMESELSNLKEESDRLEGATKDLGMGVANLQRIRAVFDHINELEDASLDFLEEQLKESELILSKLHANNLDVVLENIFDVLLVCDKDGDEKLTEDEIDDLIKSLEGINNIEINDDLMKELIHEQGDNVQAVMKLCRNIMDNDPDTGPADKDEIFKKVITFL